MNSSNDFISLSQPILIKTATDWQRAYNDTAGPSDFFLFLHSDTLIDNVNIKLLQSTLAMMQSGTIAIARVSVRNQHQYLLNGGYWYSNNDLRWHQLVLGEIYPESDQPIIEEANYTALGAVLMSRETAHRIGYFDSRFATHLADVDWLLRAKRSGIMCKLVRNARVYADPSIYPAQLGAPYAVVRDSLLLARHQSLLWPVYVGRLLHRLVWDLWRPSDWSISQNSEVSFLKRLVWAFANHVASLRKRMTSTESVATLTAVRDFILNRFYPLT